MGVVYFVRGERTGLIKIGRCNSVANFHKRVGDLQIGSPDRLIILGLVEESPEINEHRLHLMFAKLWSHGEWFYPDSQLLGFIDEYASTDIVHEGKICRKHEKLKKLQEAPELKEFKLRNSAAVRRYVKSKLAEKDHVLN